MLTTQTAQRSVTILIVEDDDDILYGMQEIIKSSPLVIDEIHYDIHIITANDGLVGLAQLENTTPDLIISDIMMPNFSGYQFLEEIQSHSTWAHIPFIFLTAKSTDEDRHKGKLQGANLYLTKPFDPETLMEHIEAQLKRSFNLKEAQEQYISAIKRKILKVLNHEFRTPLTYVISYYEMLAFRAEKSDITLEDYQEYLRGIQTGCIRLSRLIEDFMMVIELNSGEAKARFDREAKVVDDLTAVIREAVQANQRGIQGKGAVVNLNLPEELPGVWGIRPYITTILTRIIDNSVKFSNASERQPVLNIDTKISSDEVCIIINDNGQGMPEFVLNRIFELFYQYNRDTKEQQGAGVGLAISAGLTEIHQGHIIVETEDSKGSTLTIVFPKHKFDTEQKNPITKKKKANVLVLEDDPNLLDGLQDLLETIEGKYNLEVQKARNGLEGLDLLSIKLPDVIISDIMMPKMSGYDFLIEVRKNPEWLHIPIIFVTAKGKMPDKHKAFIMGVDEYITKPYESDILLSYVESQLDRRFKLQHVLDSNFDTLTRSILNLITPNFRQPLTFVNKYVDNFTESLQGAKTVDEFKDSLQGLQRGSEWLHQKIEDFMLLAEIRTGEAKIVYDLQSQKIPNIGVLLSEFSQMYAQKLQSGGISLNLKAIDTQIAPVYGNIAQISSSISRLIEISVAQCLNVDKEILVTLSAHEVDDFVAITLYIEGNLPDEAAQSMQEIIQANVDSSIDADIFQSFEFASDLCIAHGYIELQNGWIKLEKEQGDRFFFTIGLPIFEQS